MTQKSSRHSPGNGRGFSLVEVSVALFIMTLFFLGLAQSFPVALKLVTEGKLRSEAVALAQGKMEELKSYGFDGAYLVSGTDNIGGKYTRSWTIVANSPAPRMKELTVTVSWALGQRQRNVRLDSYVAQ